MGWAASMMLQRPPLSPESPSSLASRYVHVFGRLGFARAVEHDASNEILHRIANIRVMTGHFYKDLLTMAQGSRWNAVHLWLFKLPAELHYEAQERQLVLNSVLRQASLAGNVPVMKQLLQAGADPNIFGGEIVEAAVISGNTQAALTIFQSARFQPEFGLMKKIFQRLLQMTPIPYDKVGTVLAHAPQLLYGDHGVSALRFALDRPDLHLFQMLLKFGANPTVLSSRFIYNLKDSDSKRIALDAVSQWLSEYRQNDIVGLLQQSQSQLAKGALQDYYQLWLEVIQRDEWWRAMILLGDAMLNEQDEQQAYVIDQILQLAHQYSPLTAELFVYYGKLPHLSAESLSVVMNGMTLSQHL